MNGYSVVELVIVSDFTHVRCDLVIPSQTHSPWNTSSPLVQYQAHGSSVDSVVNKALSVTNAMDDVWLTLHVYWDTVSQT